MLSSSHSHQHFYHWTPTTLEHPTLFSSSMSLKTRTCMHWAAFHRVCLTAFFVFVSLFVLVLLFLCHSSERQIRSPLSRMPGAARKSRERRRAIPVRAGVALPRRCLFASLSHFALLLVFFAKKNSLLCEAVCSLLGSGFVCVLSPNSCSRSRMGDARWPGATTKVLVCWSFVLLFRLSSFSYHFSCLFWLFRLSFLVSLTCKAEERDAPSLCELACLTLSRICVSFCVSFGFSCRTIRFLRTGLETPARMPACLLLTTR